MRLLLDSHVVLWWLENAPIASEAADAIRRASSSVWVSAVTAWEFQIKSTLGKLEIPGDWETFLDKNRFERLPVHFEHVRLLAQLPQLHRDLFDRLLIAQALAEGLTLVTRDIQILQYSIPAIKA